MCSLFVMICGDVVILKCVSSCWGSHLFFRYYSESLVQYMANFGVPFALDGGRRQIVTATYHPRPVARPAVAGRTVLHFSSFPVQIPPTYVPPICIHTFILLMYNEAATLFARPTSNTFLRLDAHNFVFMLMIPSQQNDDLGFIVPVFQPFQFGAFRCKTGCSFLIPLELAAVGLAHIVQGGIRNWVEEPFHTKESFQGRD